MDVSGRNKSEQKQPYCTATDRHEAKKQPILSHIETALSQKLLKANSSEWFMLVSLLSTSVYIW